jgi:hypothetical protein
MTIALNQISPPAPPSNEALSTAMTLLAVAADPAGTERRMGELLDQIAAVRAAHAEADAARLAAEAAQQSAAALVEREQALADKQAQLDAARLQHDVAAAALQARELDLAKREAAVAKLADDLAVRERLLVDQRNSMRAALA